LELEKEIRIKKEQQQRLLNKQKYLNNNILSIKKLDNSNNNLIYYTNIQKEPGKISYIRTKNRCILTGRSHGVHRLFKKSRVKLRELASHGMILGLTKAS
jgi:ribosomal protein S14